jgi:hypothetical protein
MVYANFNVAVRLGKLQKQEEKRDVPVPPWRFRVKAKRQLK